MTRPAQLSRFIADLTSVDQLTAAEISRATLLERRRTASELRQAIYEARMLGVAAFHRAMAATTHAACARVSHWDNAAMLTGEASATVDEMIQATEHYMRLPIRSKDDERDRRKCLRQWGAAAFDSHTAARWRATEVECVALLDAATLVTRP